MGKNCSKCKKYKCFSEFHKDKNRKNGVAPYCKLCCSVKSKISYKKNPELFLNRTNRYKKDPKNREKVKESCRKYNKRPDVMKRTKDYLASSEGRNKTRAYQKKQRFLESVKIKHKTRMLVSRALRKGIIKKEPCFCGEILNIEGHHEDYNKPLDVIWLCSKHHGERHIEINREKEAQNVI